ncbi:MAG: GAF domain-containing protein [Chloroflexi bacterium]|nr:MAG: GAF domain-containing protein [Chloroflexota bacterium]
MSTASKVVQANSENGVEPGAINPFISARGAELTAHLLALSQLLNQSDSTPYWQKCAEIVLAHTGVDAVGIWLFPSHESLPEVIVYIGNFSDSRLLRIERWQAALQNTPVGDLRTGDAGRNEEFQVIEAGKIELGVGRRNEDLPILHIRLYADGLLHGGISLAFSAAWVHRQNEYSELNQFVQFITDNGLRHRQLNITRRRLDQVSLIAQVSQSLNSTLDLDVVLQDTTEMTAYVLQAQAATLFLTDERHNELLFYVPTGKAGGVLREMRIPITQGVVGWVATNRQSIIVNDAARDQRFSGQVDAETGFHTQNILCVPLLSQGRLVGVLEVLNKEAKGGFTQEDQVWLEAMASQAAVALENAHLFQNLRKEQERMIRAEEEIRRQLNRDLHDGPAQLLNLIIMNVGVARQLLERKRYDTVHSELDLLENLGRHANREIRTLLFELRPVILESQGLLPALRSYIRQLGEAIASQAQISAQMPKPELHLQAADLPIALTPQAEKHIFSVAQEAINNIRKYAEAENVWVHVGIEGASLIFSVEDDGKGFDLASVQKNYASRGSFGLLNMYERTEMLEGVLNILSPSPSTGKGTLILGRLPVRAVQRTT